MAVFSKRVVLLLLFAFLLLTIAFRYPSVDHERYQADSYFIHLLSQSIMDDGNAAWIFSPFSYIGYYPLSYPSGTPFLLADLSLMTGLSVETSILLAGMLFGLMFCLAAFCIAREFIFESRFVLLATLFMISGSRFVDTTYWVGSARGPLVVLMILSLMVAFRASSTRRNLMVPTTILLIFGCLTLHHMAVLYFFFGAAFVLASFGADYVVKRVKFHKRRILAAYGAGVATAVVLAAFGLFTFFEKVIVDTFGENSLFDLDSQVVSIVLNMGANYTTQVGLILPVAVIGVPIVYKSMRLQTRPLYPIMLLISFIPMLGHILYISMLIAPFVAVLGTMWILKWFTLGRRRKIAVIFLAAIVTGTILLPLWGVDRWNSQTYMTGDTAEVSPQVFDDAAYLNREASDGYVISNANVVSLQLSAISGARFLRSGILSVLTNDTTAEQVAGTVRLSVAGFPRNLHELFSYSGEDLVVDRNVNSLMISGARFATFAGSEYFSSHSHLFVVVDNNWPSTLVSEYYVQPASFPSELLTASWHSSTSVLAQPLSSYMMYQSERITLYLVQIPL